MVVPTFRGFSSIQHHTEAGVVMPLLKRLGVAPGEVERASCQLKVVEQERRRAAQRALWQVRELYVDHWEADRREKDWRKLASLLAEALNLAQTGEAQKEVLPAEVLGLKQQLVGNQEQAALAAQAREARRLRLAALLGLDPQTFRLTPWGPGSRPVLAYADLLRLAKASRPELQTARWRVREAQINGERAASQLCDFNLEARYYVDQYKELGTRSGAFLMARFTAPLAVFQLVRQRQETSRSEAEAQTARGEALGQEVDKEVSEALEKYQAVEMRLKVLKQQRQVMEEQLRSRLVMAVQPSVLASASGLEVLARRYQVGMVAREEAAQEAEREKAYFALLYALGVEEPRSSSAGAPRAVKNSPRTSLPLAFWVYYPDRLINGGQAKEVLDLAGEKGVTAIYLCLNRQVIAPGNRFEAGLRSFLAEAARRGIAVEALLDELTWLLPERRQDLRVYLDWIASFHARAGGPGRFQAIHLDLEINQLPRWQAEKSRYGKYLLNALQLVKALAGGLPVAVDLPVWLDREGIELWPEIIRAADRVVFMAYEQKTPELLAESLKNETALCGKLGRPYWVGVQVKDFAAGGEAALGTYLAQVNNLLSPTPAGFALFQYRDLKNWR